MKTSLFAVWFGLAVGTATMVALGPTTAPQALERTFFQGVALFAVFICERIRARS